jgi:hypothetical protein
MYSLNASTNDAWRTANSILSCMKSLALCGENRHLFSKRLFAIFGRVTDGGNYRL